MALWHGSATPPEASEAPSAELTRALCAAELGEPQNLERLPVDALHQLFSSLAPLREAVPFATMCLLAELASDRRVDVRLRVAEALGSFVDLYAERIEPLLHRLINDVSRKVRWAATASLGALQMRRPLSRPHAD
jgi:hypothetical protein